MGWVEGPDFVLVVANWTEVYLPRLDTRGQARATHLPPSCLSLPRYFPVSFLVNTCLLWPPPFRPNQRLCPITSKHPNRSHHRGSRAPVRRHKQPSSAAACRGHVLHTLPPSRAPLPTLTGAIAAAVVPQCGGTSSATTQPELYAALPRTPFPLEMVALCMLRTLRRKGHEGHLDARESAA